MKGSIFFIILLCCLIQSCGIDAELEKSNNQEVKVRYIINQGNLNSYSQEEELEKTRIYQEILINSNNDEKILKEIKEKKEKDEPYQKKKKQYLTKKKEILEKYGHLAQKEIDTILETEKKKYFLK